MKGCIDKLWRILFVTVFIYCATGCGSRDVSRDPKAVDAITVEYIFGDLAADVKAASDNVASVERVKLTRQDGIPIALVDVVYADGTTAREIYGFNFEDIVRAAEIMEQNENITATALAEHLQTSDVQATLLYNIVCRAKGKN